MAASAAGPAAEAEASGAHRRADRAGGRILSLILPAYNEARRLPASLARCAEFFRARGLDAEIIVVNDGSTDGTAETFANTVSELSQARLRYHLLNVPHRGKGAAVRAGVARASGDPIVFLDADLTIPVDIVDDFEHALADGADIAIASRYVPGSVVRRPWWRVLMGHSYRALVRALVPTGLQDTQCGGKCYTAEAGKRLFSRSRLDGFAFDAEVLFLARRFGYRIREIPFHLDQPRGSSVHFLVDAPRMLRDLFVIRLNAIRGAYK